MALRRARFFRSRYCIPVRRSFSTGRRAAVQHAMADGVTRRAARPDRTTVAARHLMRPVAIVRGCIARRVR